MYRGAYSQLAKIENTHWWFVSRRLLIKELFIKLGVNKKIGKNAKGLDIGCGTGGNLKLLNEYCPEVIGVDLSKFALKLAREKLPKQNFVYGDANQLSSLFKKESFDLVTIFNVLYHQWILNELNVLKQVFTILKPKGYLVVTEPAFSILKRRHDIQDMGRRRYRLGFFKEQLKKAGFLTLVETYFNALSFIPAFILALTNRLNSNKDEVSQAESRIGELQLPNIVLNQILLKLMTTERKIIKLVGSLPFGVTLLCIAWKPPKTQ